MNENIYTVNIQDSSIFQTESPNTGDQCKRDFVSLVDAYIKPLGKKP